jgi:hypothetical protein
MTFPPAPAIAAVGVGSYLSAGFVRDLYFALKSKQWPTTAGRVIGVEIARSSGMRGSYSSADIGYEYEVRGVRYTSHRIDYAGRGAGAMNAFKFSRRYHEGQAVTVRYDPNEPNRAVIATGVRPGNFLRLLFGFAVLWFGLLAILER